jgi:hypothetical protein
MSTQIQLHERTEEMTDEMLRSEGHLNTGMTGVLGQLQSNKDYFEEFSDLIHEADSVIVGNGVHDDGARDVADLFDGTEEVTERKVKQVSATVFNSDDVSMEVVEWLEDRVGEEVICIHW